METATLHGVQIAVEKTQDGLDISVTLPDGQHNAWHQSHDGGFDVVTRNAAIPAKGSRVMIGGKVRKVKDRLFDDNKHCFIVDEDTLEKVLWA